MEHRVERQLRPACGRGCLGKHSVSCHPQDKEKPLRQKESPKLGGGKPGMKGPGRNDQGGNSGHLCGTKYKALFLALKKLKIERTGGSSKTSKHNSHMSQPFHIWMPTHENQDQRREEVCIHPCSQQHHSRSPKDRSNPSVHQRMNRKTNCGITYNGILFSPKREGI